MMFTKVRRTQTRKNEGLGKSLTGVGGISRMNTRTSKELEELNMRNTINLMEYRDNQGAGRLNRWIANGMED